MRLNISAVVFYLSGQVDRYKSKERVLLMNDFFSDPLVRGAIAFAIVVIAIAVACFICKLDGHKLELTVKDTLALKLN